MELANDCHVANYIYTFHATLRDDELIRKMWDEGSPRQKKGCLLPAKSRRFAKGHYEVAVSWKDDEPPL